MDLVRYSKRFTTILCIACISVPVYAIEEVKVTARKRTESFQDVPVTVNVFTEAEIESAGIERARDFIALTPNATIVEVQNSGNTFIGVRGITQNRNTEPSVAILLDGVLLSNPAQFNQELYDIEQIEFLKGPQGALYGRNAIGGAIVINTKKPTDETEGKIKVGIDDGFGYKTQGVISGPISGVDNLYYRGALSWRDTDGWIKNTFLGEDSDPVEDLSGRFKLLWEPTDQLTADFRVAFSQFEGQAFNYRIAPTEAAAAAGGPFASFTGPFDANRILDVRVNNAGINHKDLTSVALKLDYDTDYGTFSSITAYDEIEEIATGDAFDFLPIAESVLFAAFGSDQSQSQYFEIETIAQEFRFTSPQEDRLRWSAGTYMIWTERFVSTGNMLDFGAGVTPLYRSPVGPAPFTPFAHGTSTTFLADSQDNFAWAVFGDMIYDVTDDFEVGLSLRYDRDTRENTTDTPTAFLPTGSGFTGQSREKTWSAMQPKLSLRWSASDNHTVYSSIARGFRSGGFNQTGVGLDPTAIALGVTDTFDKEIADTIEVGLKSQWLDGKLTTNFAAFATHAEGSYYFIFLPTSSTQNLASLDEVSYQGFEVDATAYVTDDLSVYAALGMIDSEIKKDAALGTAVEGNGVPYVSDYTFNLGANYRTSLNNIYSGLDGFIRADYQLIGQTYWEPSNVTNRRPYDLMNLRLGLDYQDNMTLTLWSKNLLDEEYNVEYSAGGFVYRGLPRQIGLDFQVRF